MENVDLFEDRKVAKVYTDGGVAAPLGGGWAYIAVDEKDELIYQKSGFLVVEDRPTTNNHTELFSVIKALEDMKTGWEGVVVSDSLVTLGRVFSGWKMKNVPQEFIERLHRAKKRLGKITGQHVKGHVNKAEMAAGMSKKGHAVSPWNNEVDALCTMENNKVKGKIK